MVQRFLPCKDKALSNISCSDFLMTQSRSFNDVESRYFPESRSFVEELNNLLRDPHVRLVPLVHTKE